MDYQQLELKIPPLLVVIIVAAISYGIAKLLPWANIAFDYAPMLALLVAIVGIALLISGAVSFRLAKTTVNPLTPEKASALVRGGIYRFTRNPMYLGFLFWLIAWCIYLNNLLAFLPLALYVLYLNRFQIQPEEQALTVLFGQEFQAYCQQVRRWL